MEALKQRIKNSGFRPQVLTKQVADLLEELILDGTLSPNQQLVEAELQKELGVSRSPVREAFRELEKKGLVVIVPRRGCFVRELTKRDIEENFPVRANLEGLAAREAHDRLDPDDLEEMEQVLAEMRSAIKVKDRERYVEAHRLFHNIFIQASGNKLLVDLLENLRMHRLWYRITYRYQMVNIANSVEIHRKIYEMLKEPGTDPDELEKLVRNHILAAMPILFGPDGEDDR